MYLDIHTGTKNGQRVVTALNWALVTSYTGVDPDGGTHWYDANGAEWQGFNGHPLTWAGGSYRPQPVIALDLDGSVSSDRLSGWDYGLMLAPDNEFFNGGDIHGGRLAGVEGATPGQNYCPALYATGNTVWRGGDWEDGFGGDSGPHPDPTNGGLRPIDFDTDGLTAVVSGWSDGRLSRARSYAEISKPVGDPGFYDESKAFQCQPGGLDREQQVNYIWEGSLTGLDLPYQPGPEIRAFCGSWCANDRLSGSSPVPEPTSIGLLALATAAVAGTVKRRRWL
jgi:hypothetical protein